MCLKFICMLWAVVVRHAMNGTTVTVLMSRQMSLSTSSTGTVTYVVVSCLFICEVSFVKWEAYYILGLYRVNSKTTYLTHLPLVRWEYSVICKRKTVTRHETKILTQLVAGCYCYTLNLLLKTIVEDCQLRAQHMVTSMGELYLLLPFYWQSRNTDRKITSINVWSYDKWCTVLHAAFVSGCIV